MSGIATAIVGGAIVGGIASNAAASKSSKAISQGADSAAQATMYSTDKQIEEITRQFDAQQRMLAPLVQNQYATGQAFVDLLGVGGSYGDDVSGGGGQDQAAFESQYNENMRRELIDLNRQKDQDEARLAELQNNPNKTGNYLGIASQQAEIAQLENNIASYDQEISNVQGKPTASQQWADEKAGRGPQAATSGSTQFARGAGGEFLDRNLDQTSLAGTQRLEDQVRGTLLAGETAGQDDYVNYIRGNNLAAATPEEDLRFQRATDVTMAGTRGGDTMTDARGNVLLADRAGNGQTMTDQRGGVSIADQRGGQTLAGEVGGQTLAGDRGGVSIANARAGVNNAGPSLTGDQYYQDVSGRSLADGAAGTSVVGENFQQSPGYAFSVEEMQREVDRKNSAGGNYGGRALLEAQRRAEGVASQDYYNWANQRQGEVNRLASAEAQDAGRLDYAGQNYLQRRDTDIARGDSFAAQDIARGDQFSQYDIDRNTGIAQYDLGRGDSFAAQDIARGDEFAAQDLARGDELGRFDITRGDSFAAQDIARADQFAQYDINRGDVALDQYQGLVTADQARGDDAYQNYLQRQAGDAARLDGAVSEADRLQAVDLQRKDQAYYNYLNNPSSAAGFGNAAGQAVSSSSAAGSQIANAYGSQGSNLSNIYQSAGNSRADIAATSGANINNAVQSGISNWVTYKAA